MAEGERTKVRLDAFTAKVVPDPKNPGESLLLTGFLGASSESKQTRIYLDASLSSYVDVDAADIIHSEPLPREQSPLGGSYIWVKRSAEVSMGSAGGPTAKGKFFQGPLMTAYGGTFGAAGAAGTGGLVQGLAPGAGTWIRPTEPCPLTHRYPCTAFNCTIAYDCSFACPTPTCPSQIVLCPDAGAPVGQHPFPVSYTPHCWYSWNACPTQFGCGPHHTPACPQVAAQPQFNFASRWCGSWWVCPPGSLGSCGHPCTR